LQKKALQRGFRENAIDAWSAHEGGAVERGSKCRNRRASLKEKKQEDKIGENLID